MTRKTNSKPGRPTNDRRNVTVRLSFEEETFLREYGHGSISQGIYRLMDRFRSTCKTE